MNEQFQKVHLTLYQVRAALQSDDLAVRVQDGTPAAELHAFYNQMGMKEGWLKPEYATPLSRQDAVNQQKNVDAALVVVNYWIPRFDYVEGLMQPGSSFRSRFGDEAYDIIDHGRKVMVEEMELCVEYQTHRNLRGVREGAESEHQQWRRFVATYQKERITPGHEKFRKDNYDQFKMDFAHLTEQLQDQDRTPVAVICDVILGLADNSYRRKISTSQIFN